MTRKETTKFLSDLLIRDRLNKRGVYWASEVTLNYGSADVKRVDFMQFKPVNTMSASGIEKGEFICYEVKSCVEDYKSGHGQNFVGERNYFVMPMALYKSAVNELKSNYYIGVMVPVPDRKGWYDEKDLFAEFENPTELDPNIEWKLRIIKPTHPQNRKHSLAELLFCMLRSGKS